jgi:hypothetical protein
MCVYQENGCLLPRLTVLPHLLDIHKSLHTKQYDVRKDIFSKPCLSSPSLTEDMHCSSEQFTAKCGHQSDFSLRIGHRLYHYNQFMNLFQHQKLQENET